MREVHVVYHVIPFEHGVVIERVDSIWSSYNEAWRRVSWNRDDFHAREKAITLAAREFGIEADMIDWQIRTMVMDEGAR